MPRSAGTYSLPANAHAVSGNSISSSDFNAVLDDFANEMTNSLPRDGTAAMSGVLKATAGSAIAPSYTFGIDSNTGFYSYGAEQIGVAANGAAVGYFSAAGWNGNVVGNITGVATFAAYQDVASATTTDIGAATSNFVNITGTTTITGLGTAAAGVFRFLKFAGVLTFTHNATSLILPGAANITTAAGDTAEAESLGSGNWRVRAYHKASGLALVSPSVLAGANVTVTTGTGTYTIAAAPTSATAQATTSGTAVDFTGIPSTAKRITLSLAGVSTTGTSVYAVQVGAGSIQTTAYLGSAGVSASFATTATSYFDILGVVPNAASTVHGIVTLTLIGSNRWAMTSVLAFSDTNSMRFAAGSVLVTGTLDRIRLTTAGGTDTFDAGTVNIMYE
jgi:hypothetical protein